jgi:hypothetical protein
MYGNKIFVNTDNKTLIFLQKCVITSKKVARWLITIQKYNIELPHIRGDENHLADILSLNTAGFEVKKFRIYLSPHGKRMIAQVVCNVTPCPMVHSYQISEHTISISWE